MTGLFRRQSDGLPLSGVRYVGCCRTSTHVHTPLNNPCPLAEGDLTEIEVTDPTHPLFGRRFPMLSSRPQAPTATHVFVTSQGFMVLRLPRAATTLLPLPPRMSTPLTSHAITDLIALAEPCEVLCHTIPDLSGPPAVPHSKPPSAPSSRPSSRRSSMYSAEVITPQHLTRKAVISLRQSTPHQALSHQESLRLQYALTERAQALGWSPEAMEVVETDGGRSAASAQHREGFHTLVGQVTLGHVGLMLSYDVTRLSRNCSDWYPLVDLWSSKGCLMADVDGLDDPSTANGRLLLG